MLRWEACVKRDVKKAGEEEDWKKKARDRGGWKRLADEAVKKLQAAPHPSQIKGNTRKRERERDLVEQVRVKNHMKPMCQLLSFDAGVARF